MEWEKIKTIFVFTIIICLAVFLYFGVPWLYGRWARISIRRRAKKSKALVLTFDDGPGNKLTPAILKILSENNVNATFFLLGRNIVGRENIVRQIAAEGHEICSHGYGHLHHWKVSPVRALADIKRGWQAIDSALGEKRGTYGFRPPYGKLSIVSLLYLWFRRVPILYWSLDTRDTWPAHKRNCEPIDVVIKETGGAVTLAHDFDRSDDTLDPLVLESVRSALVMAGQTGMQVLTCSQLFNRGKREN